MPCPFPGMDPFATVYERGGYQYLLDYCRPAKPPLSEEEQM